MALAAVWAVCAGGVPARAADIPECQFGAYLTSVYNVDPGHSQFSARFWVWSLCPNLDALPGRTNPLKDVEFANASSPVISNQVEDDKGPGGSRRYIELVDGVFRQHINEKNFPFDKPHLWIQMTSPYASNVARLTADERDSSRADFDVPGWTVTGFHVTTAASENRTNFGRGDVPPGAITPLDQFRIGIDLEHADKVGFVRTVGPLGLITLFALAIVVFATRSHSWLFELRIPGLAALVFAVLLNMGQADANISSDGFSMVDQLHILTLGLLFVAALESGVALLMSMRHVESGRIRAFEHRAAIMGTVVYLGMGAALIATAAIRG